MNKTRYVLVVFVIAALGVLIMLSGCASQTPAVALPAPTASALLQEASPSPAPVESPSAVPSTNTPAPAATPAAPLSPSPKPAAVDAMYEQATYKDKNEGLEIKYPKGWEVSNPDGELVRFTGPIINGSTGYAAVSISAQKYSDLTQYDAYAKGLVEENNPDRDVTSVQNAFIFTNENKQGRFQLIAAANKADSKDTHVYYYYFLPLGKKVYQVAAFSTGPDFNTVFKAYTMLMSSMKK